MVSLHKIWDQLSIYDNNSAHVSIEYISTALTYIQYLCTYVADGIKLFIYFENLWGEAL